MTRKNIHRDRIKKNKCTKILVLIWSSKIVQKYSKILFKKYHYVPHGPILMLTESVAGMYSDLK